MFERTHAIKNAKFDPIVIWVYTVCLDLFVKIFSINMALEIMRNYQTCLLQSSSALKMVSSIPLDRRCLGDLH